MRNTFGPSRSMLALAIALAGLAGGCNDSGGPRDNQQDAPASAPQNVFVPALSADENSLVLVWEKPESETEQVVDYAVYRQGERLGHARENQNHFSPAKPYIDNFYQRIASDGWQQQIDLRTFTVTNLGGLGIESFTPVLNPPEVAILGVGNINLKAVARGDASLDSQRGESRVADPLSMTGQRVAALDETQVVFVPHIGLSLTINHQVVDGAPAARFLQALARNLAEIDLLLAG